MPVDDVAMLRLYMTLQMDCEFTRQCFERISEHDFVTVDLGDDAITQQLARTSEKRPSAETSMKLNKRQRTT
jgi:hypothetical protein